MPVTGKNQVNVGALELIGWGWSVEKHGMVFVEVCDGRIISGALNVIAA
jgi:hypothetical protein